MAELDRFKGVFDALTANGVEPEGVVYAEEVEEDVRRRLLAVDGVLVWVDPISKAWDESTRDRSRLDELLRDVASHGTWVSAHPDVILRMGTKEVLYLTREMSWGMDIRLYRAIADLREQLPSLLAAGPRVLKQSRGNGGNGVWKVEFLPGLASGAGLRLRVQHATRGTPSEELTMEEFIARCGQYFTGSGFMVDQPFQSQLERGMVRCYLSNNRVVGFGYQAVNLLLPPPSGSSEPPLPTPRVYYGHSEPMFQELKAKMENEWVVEMQRIIDVPDESLPAIWDADFLYGPKDSSGKETFLLGEINVSSVYPFPVEGTLPLAREAVARVNCGKRSRRCP